jgi:hypothetical protein
MASFAIRLTETSQVWARAIGPVAEMVGRQLTESTTRKRTSRDLPPTRFTQTNKREATAPSSQAEAVAMPRSENLCRIVGTVPWALRLTV